MTYYYEVVKRYSKGHNELLLAGPLKHIRECIPREGASKRLKYCQLDGKGKVVAVFYKSEIFATEKKI